MDAVLAEFGALRTDMNDRARRGFSILALNVTTTAGIFGLVFSGRVDERYVLLVALLIPALGRLWIDQHEWIGRFARYVNDHLRALAVDLAAGAPVLGWEEWLRMEGKPEAGSRRERAEREFWFTIAALFLFAPIVALAVGFEAIADDPRGWPWWLLGMFSLISVVARLREMRHLTARATDV